jgi:Tfp pilus assembly protein PilO
MGVSGTYHDLGLFLSEVGSLQRIVTPTELKLATDPTLMSKQGVPLVAAGFRIVTYVLPDPLPLAIDSTRLAYANR